MTEPARPCRRAPDIHYGRFDRQGRHCAAAGHPRRARRPDTLHAVILRTRAAWEVSTTPVRSRNSGDPARPRTDANPLQSLALTPRTNRGESECEHSQTPSACGFTHAGMRAGADRQPTSRSINIIVGFSAGGGYDSYARVLSRHMDRYLAGHPRIIVQNMPGGSSLKAVLYLDGPSAPKDGTMMTAFNPGLIIESLLAPGKAELKFDQVAWVGSISQDFRACYSWGETGIKTFADLQEISAVQRRRAGGGIIHLHQCSGAEEHLRRESAPRHRLPRQCRRAACDRATRIRWRLRRLEQQSAGMARQEEDQSADHLLAAPVPKLRPACRSPAIWRPIRRPGTCSTS